MTTQQPPSELDRELQELCKEVYERQPEWKDANFWWMPEMVSADNGQPLITSNYIPVYQPTGSRIGYPLYTSDYILEKLPRFIRYSVTRKHKEHGCMSCSCQTTYKTYLELSRSDEKAMACYVSNLNSRAIPYLERADTPLKALLKLVIALDDAGTLTGKPNPQ